MWMACRRSCYPGDLPQSLIQEQLVWPDPVGENDGAQVYVAVSDTKIDAANRRISIRAVSFGHLPTLPGARTSCLVPELKRLYVGVWGRGSQPAELRVYEIQP